MFYSEPQQRTNQLTAIPHAISVAKMSALELWNLGREYPKAALKATGASLFSHDFWHLFRSQPSDFMHWISWSNNTQAAQGCS